MSQFTGTGRFVHDLSIIRDSEVPTDLKRLAKTPDGKSAVFTGDLRGKADALHGRDYNAQCLEGTDLSIQELAQQAYRQAYLSVRERK